MEHARHNTDFYGPSYAGVRLVWEVLSTEETDEYYDIKLHFRPAGRFRGEPGVEQFIFDKRGELRIRQMLDEPTELGETVDSAASGPTASAASPAEPTSHPAPTTSAILTPAPELTFPTIKWGSRGSTDGQFKNPRGIAVDWAGNVYVAYTDNNRVQVFDASGQFLFKWGAEGSGDGQFDAPTGIAADGAGKVYVADRHNHRVQVFDRDRRFLRKWGSEGRGDGQFNYPIHIAVDGAGNAYVIDWGNHRVQVFDSNGRFQRQWGSVGSDDGQFDAPTGIAVDGAGSVYVSDADNHRVQVFAPVRQPYA